MSHKVMKFNLRDAKKVQYESLESSGESQQAIWDFIETLHNNGIDIGEKALNILNLRNQIKQRNS